MDRSEECKPCGYFTHPPESAKTVYSSWNALCPNKAATRINPHVKVLASETRTMLAGFFSVLLIQRGVEGHIRVMAIVVA
jgi:hypothetical protein